MEKNKKILVIGGSGFIGSTLIPSLLSKGYVITVLNRGNKLMAGTKQLTADRNDLEQVQLTSHNAGVFDAVIDTSSYNLRHTEIVWEVFSKKTKHWIHLSSAAVYKETPDRFPSEKDELGGAKVWGEYGIEKTEVDNFLLHHSLEIPITVFRPPYLYGPNNDNDRETFIWSRVLQGRPIVVPAEGKTPIQFLHVEDLVNAFEMSLMSKPDGIAIYNIGSDEQMPFIEWIRTLSKVAGINNPNIIFERNITNFQPRQYFPFRNYPCCIDINLIKQQLKWHAKYNIETGFEQTFKTYDVNLLKNKKLETKVEDEITSIVR